MGQKKRTVADMVVNVPPGGFSPDVRPQDALTYPGLSFDFYTPTDYPRDLVSRTPAPAPTRVSVASLLQVPSAATGAFLGALVDEPSTSGATTRLDKAVSAAGRAGFQAPFEETPTSPAQEAAKRGVTELEGIPGLLYDLMADPSNMVGGDPVTDVAKVGVAMAGMTPKMAARASGALGRLYSRVAEEVLPRLGKSQHANKVRSLLKSFATSEEVAHLGLEELLASKGDKPVTLEELEKHVGENQLRMRETVRGVVAESDAAKEMKALQDKIGPVHVWAEQMDDETTGVLEAIDDYVREGGAADPAKHKEILHQVIRDAGGDPDLPILVEVPGSDGSRWYHPTERVPIRSAGPSVTGPRMYDINEELGEAPPAIFTSIPETIRRRFPRAQTFGDLAEEYFQAREAEQGILGSADYTDVETVDGPPKYERYTLPGEKKDYRELLVQMPEIKKNPPSADEVAEVNALFDRVNEKNKQGRFSERGYERAGITVANYGSGWSIDSLESAHRGLYSQDELSRMRDVIQRSRSEGARYKSPHWEEPDIVTHVRYDTRDVGGEPALFVEEVQSDWDQAAREKGYADPRRGPELDKVVEQRTEDLRALIAEHAPAWGYPADIAQGSSAGHLEDVALHIERMAKDGVQNAMRVVDGRPAQHGVSIPANPELAQKMRAALDARLNAQVAATRARSGVADQPFKGTKATELGVKRMLLKAADQGLDQVAWTTGKQQAERYNKLLRDVKEVVWEPRAGNLSSQSTGGESFDGYLKVGGRSIELKKSELRHYIGEENAKKLLEARYTPKYNTSQLLAEPGSGMTETGAVTKPTMDRLEKNYVNARQFIDYRTGQIKKSAYTVIPQFETRAMNGVHGGDRDWWGMDVHDREVDGAGPWRVLYDSPEAAKKAADEWLESRKHLGREIYRLDTSASPLTIGSRGMNQQYDETMVAQFNKLGKPYGAKAEKVPMEGVGQEQNLTSRLSSGRVRAPHDADYDLPYLTDDPSDPATGEGYIVELPDLDHETYETLADTDSADARLILKSIGRIHKTRAEAQRALETAQTVARRMAKGSSAAGDEVWRFRIPDKMREDLATRGLPLLAAAPVMTDEDLSAEDKAKLLGLGALAVVLRGKFGKDPAMVKMVEELAKKPADLSRAAKKAGLTGTAEENALALFKQYSGGKDAPEWSEVRMAGAMRDAGIKLPGKTKAEREAANLYVEEMLKRSGANKAAPPWYLKDPKVVRAIMEEQSGAKVAAPPDPDSPFKKAPAAVAIGAVGAQEDLDPEDRAALGGLALMAAMSNPKTLKRTVAAIRALKGLPGTAGYDVSTTKMFPSAQTRKRAILDIADAILEERTYGYSPEFLDSLKDEQVPVEKIVPTQSVVDKYGVLQMRRPLPADAELGDDIAIAVKVDDKYYVVDGHHRTAAQISKGRKKVSLNVLDVAGLPDEMRSRLDLPAKKKPQDK